MDSYNYKGHRNNRPIYIIESLPDTLFMCQGESRRQSLDLKEFIFYWGKNMIQIYILDMAMK